MVWGVSEEKGERSARWCIPWRSWARLRVSENLHLRTTAATSAAVNLMYDHCCNHVILPLLCCPVDLSLLIPGVWFS